MDLASRRWMHACSSEPGRLSPPTCYDCWFLLGVPLLSSHAAMSYMSGLTLRGVATNYMILIIHIYFWSQSSAVELHVPKTVLMMKMRDINCLDNWDMDTHRLPKAWFCPIWNPTMPEQFPAFVLFLVIYLLLFTTLITMSVLQLNPRK